MRLKLTLRIWILIIAVLLSLVSIFSLPPIFLSEGVLVSGVQTNTSIFEDGLREGMVIVGINNNRVSSLEDYNNEIEFIKNIPKNATEKVTITTTSLEIVNLYSSELADNILVAEIPNTRIKTGLDLQGGSRALVKADQELTEEDLDDLISVSEQRLNVYGFSDVKFFKVLTSSGDRLMGVEIAGSTPDELESLISEQGKFEAKIGNETVFIGGDKDITRVARTGSEALITDCQTSNQPQQHRSGATGTEFCNFQFTIYLSEEAAKRHARITDELSFNGSYLSKQLDFFIDDKLTSSLNIGASLKGNVATQIAISGSGVGNTRTEAIDNAESEMNRLQTILITGSLPYKLEIVKIDKISPNLGKEFIRQIVLAGLFGLLAVSIIVFVRYRKIKISLALITVSASEVVVILGVASLIGWNLDLPSIAGIIAAIGTGIDSQLIILDEARDKRDSIKARVKKALFIIATAFATTTVAMIPLTGLLGFMGIGAASAGLLKGFAITTIIGLTTGVLISRPAFADIASKIEE